MEQGETEKIYSKENNSIKTDSGILVNFFGGLKIYIFW